MAALTYGPIDVYAVSHQDEPQLDAPLGAVVEQFVARHGPVDVQLDLLQYGLSLVVERQGPRLGLELARYRIARLFQYSLDLNSIAKNVGVN